MNKIVLGISSCLLGNKVRYDGGHKLDHFLTDTLGRYVDWVPVCPEAACGLAIPREAMALEGAPASPRIRTVWTGIDHTARIKKWIKGELSVLEDIQVNGFVLKARSPSCGVSDTKVFDAASRVRGIGPGLFTRSLRERFPLLPIEDEDRMQDPAIRENFIVRVFTYRRWREFMKQDGTLGGLVAFHSDHKYLIMAHSQKHCKELGVMVANGKNLNRKKLLADYIETLMTGLKLLATAKKNTNVLQHLAGYFKEQFSAEEKKDLQEVIASHHDGLVPLIVPVTLLNHYTRKYREHYLSRQVYLHPHPLELMLRNHG